MESKVATRLLILSDTHGEAFEAPKQDVDVVIHCGDLTDGSQLDEFRTTIESLKRIKAPLKLVIAGNHDFTMDIPAFEQKIADAVPALEPELVAQAYGTMGQARQLFEEARSDGIIFLDEGTHKFALGNGALLTVYASPYTPSLGAWGFQYNPNRGREFTIEEGTDIAITHGPPRGIMDLNYARERTGCPDLFAAVARARPGIHCFGHIHEGWGARVVTWKDCGFDRPSHFTAINNDKSPIIERLAGLRGNTLDSPEMVEEKRVKLERMARDGCYMTSHCSQDEYQLERGKETLFVNAAIKGSEDFVQRPWLVDIELPRQSA